MFATIGAWVLCHVGTNAKWRRSWKYATETQENAQPQGMDVKLVGARLQNWPLFFTLWQIIGCVSAYDAFLAMKYRSELCNLEKNLLGNLLLRLDHGDPALFLSLKFMGTMMVLGILANLYHSRPQRGLAVAKGVAAYQMALLAYLTLG